MSKVFTLGKGAAQSYQIEMAVASGTTASIAAGVPTKKSSAKAAIMADADGTTSQVFSGIAKNVSSETASVAGIVQLWQPVPGLHYRGFAKSAAAADTQAEIDALVGARVVFDLTSTDWTVDTAASNAATNCVIIVGGSPQDSSIEFAYAASGTVFANVTTA